MLLRPYVFLLVLWCLFRLIQQQSAFAESTHTAEFLQTATSTALAKPDLATLQDFNDILDKTVTRKYDMNRKPLLCFLRIMKVGDDDAPVPIWAWQGTTLSAFRGWNAPWDHDMDFAFVQFPNYTKVLQGIWKNHTGIQGIREYPECEGMNIDPFTDGLGAKIQNMEFDLWELEVCKAGNEKCQLGKEADWLCGWICIPRSEIFPTQLVDVTFYEPPTGNGSSKEEYSLGKVVKLLPAMGNLTSFMDRYAPFNTARTQSSYNYYNSSQGKWIFDMQTYYNHNLAGGPPIVYSNTESDH